MYGWLQGDFVNRLGLTVLVSGVGAVLEGEAGGAVTIDVDGQVPQVLLAHH